MEVDTAQAHQERVFDPAVGVSRIQREAEGEYALGCRYRSRYGAGESGLQIRRMSSNDSGAQLMIKTWRDIPGFFDFLDIYDQAVADSKDGDILIEVGCYLGKSTAYMAERIKENEKGQEFFAVDSWDENAYKNWWTLLKDDPPSPWPVSELVGMPLSVAFRYAMIVTDSSPFISVMQTTSIEAAESFPYGSLSFVFIDADHRYPGIFSDIAAWRHKVKPGGILAGHDYKVALWPDVTRAVDEAFGDRVEHRGNSWVVRM